MQASLPSSAAAGLPPHVEYTLTPLGQDIAGHVQALADCVEGNLMRSLQAQAQAPTVAT
ncbi:winged helix-turn-helix transcriptional regulator [Roseateles sp.]|uniref:winged helix-turn-helix transcriptional regulator n=1 Tax=Roseateles sp. TaxID=1971397 RepID=UPI003266285A